MKKLILAVALSVGAVVPLSGQLPLESDPGRTERTRADLENLLAEYTLAMDSPAYSNAVKASLRERAARIRDRLERGDFRLGDRITLYVEGEPNLPDTVPVEAGPMISLPLFGDISLEGVLRSEIQAHIGEELKTFIRSPVVRAKALMRISIQGAVGQPGFYVVPADMLLGEALMVAGGPAQNARLDDLRIDRGTQTLVDGEDLQEAVRGGLTLDQLNLQAGDQIMMPERGAGILQNIALVAGLLGTLSILLLR